MFTRLYGDYNPLYVVPVSARRLIFGKLVVHGVYFCSPFIGSAPKGRFRNEVFMIFCDYYVSGSNKIFKIVVGKGVNNYFYPSTVFLSEQPLNMVEYTEAKTAVK